MASRVVWRRIATAAGMYGATALGFLATVVAFRELGYGDYNVFALVLLTTGFLQILLDLTTDEAVIKFGFHYSAREDWGRFRRLFRTGLQLKWAGGLLGALGTVVLALVSPWLFDLDGVRTPLLVAALVPLLQAPEWLAAAALVVAGRYDVRAGFFFIAMALRLAGIAVGASFGVVEAVIGLVIAQAIATGAITAAGFAQLRRFPAAEPSRFGEDAKRLRDFVLVSTATSTLVSARGLIPGFLLGIVAPAHVGYFRLAQNPQTALAALSSPARYVLLAEQTRDFEHGRHASVYRLLLRYVAGTLAFAAVLVPVGWWLMPTLVRWIFGPTALPAVNAARIFLVVASIQLVFAWTKTFPVSIGRLGLRILAHGIELVVLIPTLIVFASKWQATGAAAAVAVSTSVFAAVWTVLLLKLKREALGPVQRVDGESELSPLEAVTP